MRHGVWILGSDWAELEPEQRHAAFVHATALRCDPDSPPVFSHASAAAVWGMPRVEPWPRRADAVVVDRRVRSSRLVVKHVGSPTDPVVVRGLLVTSAARTVVDVARTSGLPDALAAADHALRHGLCAAGEIAAEIDLIGSAAPGRARAALVGELADPSSMSAGESLSRAQMFIARIPRPELQFRVTDEAGHVGDADFRWRDALGEFDGRVKYRVPPGASPAQAGDVVWAEKLREDRMRRRGFSVGRWIWQDAYGVRGMLARLAGVGVVPERRSTWFDLGGRPAASA